MKGIEIQCASASSLISEVPLARRAHDALLASGQNPSLAEVIESVFQQHGVRLSKVEAARQLDGHRQGHSGTSAKAHDASGKAAEASDRVRTATEHDDPAELHACAQTAHEAAAKAHMDACLYHGRAMAYHGKKVENAAVEISEPEDDEPAK